MANVIELFCAAQSEISILKEAVNAIAVAEHLLKVRATEKYTFLYNTDLPQSLKSKDHGKVQRIQS